MNPDHPLNDRIKYLNPQGTNYVKSSSIQRIQFHRNSSMFSLFKRPFEKETLESWSKMCDDVAKVAILAEPVVIWGNADILIKVINGVLLLIAIYIFLNLGRKLKQAKLKLEEE